MSRVAGRACLVALGIAAVGPARPAAGQDVDRLTGRFQVVLDSLRRADGFPGATAAFALPDGRVIGVATGLADRERREPMTAESRMLSASIGKTFVAATALALAKEGKLDLDGPIAAWLGGESWFPRLPQARAITLRMLLSHSAGLENHVSMPSFLEDWKQGRAADRDFACDPVTCIGYILERPPLFPPGRGYHYTDTGYLVVGLVIEKAAGVRFYDIVRRRFLEPLGLDLTGPSDRRRLPGLAAGYSDSANPFGLPAKHARGGTMAWNPALEWTGGGFASNPKDLVRWAKALFEEKAMPAPYLGEMLAGMPGNTAREPAGSRYGLGVRIAETPFGVSYGHGGSIPGYRSQVAYFPDRKVAVALQVNSDESPVSGRIGDYFNALIRVLFE